MPLPSTPITFTAPESQTPVLAPLTLTPKGGGGGLVAATLYKVSYDEVQNVTFDWEKPDRYVLPQLQALSSLNVSQYRNRAAAFVCIADPGAQLVVATWQELDPLTRTLRGQTQTGVLLLKSSAVGRDLETAQLILYRCTALYLRSTGQVYQ